MISQRLSREQSSEEFLVTYRKMDDSVLYITIKFIRDMLCLLVDKMQLNRLRWEDHLIHIGPDDPARKVCKSMVEKEDTRQLLGLLNCWTSV